MSAVNQLAVSALQSTFGIIDWPQKVIDQIDTRARKYLTMYMTGYIYQDTKQEQGYKT